MTRSRPSLRHPAILLSTWFGTGYLPMFPGTWGSLAAFPAAWGLYWAGGPWLLLAGVAILFPIGLWATGVYLRRTGQTDPGQVVVDEVAGQWLALTVAVPDPILWGLGFALFRLFDIVKPWPIDIMERKIPGALGVMADDIMAGAYAAVVLAAIQEFVL